MKRKEVLTYFDQYSAETEARVAEGIEKNRKGDGVITVYDKNGKPLSGVKLTLKQKTHEFRFGANLFMLEEFETPEKNEIYKERFAELFNMATLPFYWSDLEPEQGKPRFAADSPRIYRRPAIDLCLKYCKEKGIEPKAHCLTYVNFTPKWVDNNNIPDTKAKLEKRYQVLSERYSDVIHSWEVINETLCYGNPQQKTAFFQMPNLVEWNFNLAERFFPKNNLILNEATPFIWTDRTGDRANYWLLIDRALRNGARIDSIGMQFHMFRSEEELLKQYVETCYNPDNLFKVMDSYAAFGKPMQVTEITIPAYSPSAEDEELQAELAERLYSIWFSQKEMEAIIYWNVPDGYAAFGPQGDMTQGENGYRGGLLHYDMTKKPIFDRLKNLIWNKWRTETAAESDENGAASFRGFFGTYEVLAERNGKQQVFEVNLSKNGNNGFKAVLD